MLSIGEFSKICQVSVKTLHHYDKLGLLVPAQVDAETGYRYYEAAQLDRMLLIARLKRYGFSLAEIRSFLDADDDAKKTNQAAAAGNDPAAQGAGAGAHSQGALGAPGEF